MRGTIPHVWHWRHLHLLFVGIKPTKLFTSLKYNITRSLDTSLSVRTSEFVVLVFQDHVPCVVRIDRVNLDLSQILQSKIWMLPRILHRCGKATSEGSFQRVSSTDTKVRMERNSLHCMECCCNFCKETCRLIVAIVVKEVKSVENHKKVIFLCLFFRVGFVQTVKQSRFRWRRRLPP